MALVATVSVSSSCTSRRADRPPPRRVYAVTRTVLARYPLGPGGPVEDLRWSPDGRKLAVALKKGRLFLLPDRQTFWHTRKEADGYETRIWWSPDGVRLALLWAEALEILNVTTGERQLAADGVSSVAWLSPTRQGARLRPWDELTLIRTEMPEEPYGEIYRLLIDSERRGKGVLRRVRLPDKIQPTALSADGRLLLVGLRIENEDTVQGEVSLWRPAYPEGKLQWSRRLDYYWEYPLFSRAAWSEPMQAAALSWPGATDGESIRRLTVVTRTREFAYAPERFAGIAQLQSDPVWLGNQVIFADGGWDDLERKDRKWSYALSSFEVPSERHRALFTGDEPYAAPAVSPDNRKLAFAQQRRGRWEIVVVAIR